MTENKTLINDYLQALSGRSKPADLVGKYVSDPSLGKHIAEVEAAFANYEIVPDDMLAEGDRVVVRATFRGVQRGPFAGIEATGKAVSAGLIIIYRIENRKIAQHWMEFDRLSLLQQLQEASAAMSA